MTKRSIFPFGFFKRVSLLEQTLEVIRKDLQSKNELLAFERSEQALLMNAISDAVLIVDTHERPVTYNDRFISVFSVRRNDPPKLLSDITREPLILERFRKVIGSGERDSIDALPLEIGSRRNYFSISISPLIRDTGVVYGAVGIFHDVTALKRAEQIRIDFVANVSHELRTPLTSIKGYSDTLRADIESGRPIDKGFIEIIDRNADRLMNLINDLLDLSSLESGESDAHDLDLVETSTVELTERVLKTMDARLRRKGHKVTLNIQSKLIKADARRVEQVLVNLLDNACKYTPDDGNIRVEWVLDGKGIQLRVHNSGPGIAAEHQERLFERFYRADHSRTRDMGGTGLGLAIVKHILQRHGGNVWVDSTPGNGATFVCEFPQE